jgi:hypothetical protein
MNIVKENESESMATRVALHPFLAISFLKDDCAPFAAFAIHQT